MKIVIKDLDDNEIKCDHCIQPATLAAVDVIRFPGKNGFWRCKPKPDTERYGCKDHPPRPSETFEED